MPAAYTPNRSRPSYVELVHNVVREAPGPLPFQEIQRRVEALGSVLTQNPRNTIRSAVSQSTLIVGVGDRLYGWKPRILNGSVLRLKLDSADVKGPVFEFTDEVRDALWPGFFATAKFSDREPVHVLLPHGQETLFPLEFLGEGHWGSPATAEFWEWMKGQRAGRGDALLISVVDGEARTYAVKLQRRGERNEAAIQARNQEIVQAALRYVRDLKGNAVLWELSTHLLALGFYRHPVPPDALKEIWTTDIWLPELQKKKPRTGGWVRVDPRDEDPLVESLHRDMAMLMPGQRRRTGAQATPAPVGRAPGPIYQLRIELLDSQPPIWRRLLVPNGVNLMEVHGVLQIAMGWTNSHLHMFQAGETRYSAPIPGEPDELGTEDERGVSLGQIAPERGSSFNYTYDYGDSWEHRVVVEEILPREDGAQYPRVVGGERRCPPEDVGGIWGYADFLEAIRDRKHPAHKEMREWIGGKFDPEAFDPAGVNRILQLL